MKIKKIINIFKIIIILMNIILLSFILYIKSLTCDTRNNYIIPNIERFKSIETAYGKYIKEIKFNKATSKMVIIMKDGAEIVWDDGILDKPFKQLLNTPDLEDQVSIIYQSGRTYAIPDINQDPGTYTCSGFF